MRQGRKRTAEGEDGARLISNGGDAGAHRLAGRRIGLGNAAQRLRHRVRPGQMRVRSLRAVTGDRDVDELRVDLLQILVTKAVLLRRARSEVLAEDIRSCDELAQNVPTLGSLEIERDALHPAVVGLEERARM